MTRKHFEELVEEKGFSEAISILEEQESPYELTDFNTLKERAISLLEEDNLRWALHILNAIYDSSSDSEWYAYDYTAGTTYTPHCLVDTDDVERWLRFDEEE